MVIDLVRRALRRLFELVERPLDRLFGPALNPIAQLGALGFFFFWIVAVSGIYLFIFFDTGIERAYESVEQISTYHRYHAGVVRSLHRYASDLMVVVAGLHLLREFSRDRYRGARWYSWFTGLPVIWLLYVSGITGYWLVWDRLAQYVAVVSSELLDWLPIFGEPIARNFIATGTLTSRFFTLMVFLHVAVPLFLLLLMWVHILRISRPKVNPPRTLAVMSLLALVGVALWRPAVSQGPAILTRAPVEVGLDWYFLPLYPLTDIWGSGAVWAFLGAFSLLIGLMPWLPPLRRARPATVDLDHCNGCARCADDCPYEAIRMVNRSDGLPFASEAQVNGALCVSCGICMASCPSSTPFRRSGGLATGIDLPDLPLRALRERTTEVAAGLASHPRILVFACEHSAARGRRPGVTLPCAAMLPPSFVDFVLSRGLADGVVVAGCATNACHHRLGPAWTEQRFAGQRDPHLRPRVPRDRLATVWESSSPARAEAAIEAFAGRVAALPELRSSGPASVARSREPASEPAGGPEGAP